MLEHSPRATSKLQFHPHADFSGCCQASLIILRLLIVLLCRHVLLLGGNRIGLRRTKGLLELRGTSGKYRAARVIRAKLFTKRKRTCVVETGVRNQSKAKA
jgi:hypothetical protein